MIEVASAILGFRYRCSGAVQNQPTETNTVELFVLIGVIRGSARNASQEGSTFAQKKAAVQRDRSSPDERTSETSRSANFSRPIWSIDHGSRCLVLWSREIRVPPL